MPDNNPNNANADDSTVMEGLFNAAAGDTDFFAGIDNPGQSTGAPISDEGNGAPPVNGGAASEPNSDPAQSDAEGGNNNDASNGDQSSDDPKDDPNRIQYWQSRADKAQAELEQLRSQMEAQSPIMKYINENPRLAQKVYGVVQEELQGSSNDVPSSTPNSPAQADQPLPERPQRPTKPENYDPMEAISNTESPSYKYRVAMEEYNDQLADYNEEIVRRQEVARQRAEQQRQQSLQRQQQLKEVYNEAVYRHGMQRQEATEFVKWVSNPEYGMEDLVGLFRLRANSNRGANTAAQINNRNQNLQTPPPPSANGNATVPQQTPNPEEDEINGFVEGIFGMAGVSQGS